jgi:prenyltransferase beta subunit
VPLSAFRRLRYRGPFAVRGQSVVARFADIIADLFGLKGQVIALSSESRGGADGRLFVAFYVQEVVASSELDRRGLRWRELVVLQELLDPNVSTQLQNAFNLVRAHRIADDLKDAWSVKRARLLQLLRERMAEKDGLIGWTQFLVGDSVGVLSTAQGILTFLESGEAYESMRQNIQTLRTLQNDDGGWPVRRALIGHSERSITESTVYCLWALSGAGTDLQDSAVVRGIEWLERAQLKDGGWGSTTSAPRARTYPTAFATRYLACSTGSSNAVKQAISWLRESQNADGGWGPLRGAEPARSRGSTLLHTAHALRGLLAAGAERGDQQVASGVNYLRSSFRASDSSRGRAPLKWRTWTQMQLSTSVTLRPHGLSARCWNAGPR